jgi:hypothetical protein
VFPGHALRSCRLPGQLFISALPHHFADNDNSENFIRLHDNLHELRLRLLPALLNIYGYTIPLVIVFQRHLTPLRLRNDLFILPIWFAVMFLPKS